MKTLPIILMLLSFFKPPGAPSGLPPILSAETAAAIFSCRVNEEGHAFEPGAVALLEGSFTASGRKEAIVSFSDAAQSHDACPAEIWLLRLVGDTWEPILKITESDTAEFATTDLNGDGVLEILTHTSVQKQGYLVINRQLLYFEGEQPMELLTFEGFDNTGWPDEGICAFDARFAFKDVNRDAILEIELTEYYDYCRKEGDESVFERRSERKTLFRPLISSSGSIIGIERLK